LGKSNEQIPDDSVKEIQSCSARGCASSRSVDVFAISNQRLNGRLATFQHIVHPKLASDLADAVMMSPNAVGEEVLFGIATLVKGRTAIGGASGSAGSATRRRLSGFAPAGGSDSSRTSPTNRTPLRGKVLISRPRCAARGG
jgi:hypothetical protein